jgi:predicted nucleic acid-binding protein
MSVVLDSTVLVDLLRGLPAATQYLESLHDAPTCSEVSRVEIIRGLRSHERSTTFRLFDDLSWVAVDDVISRRAGELGRAHRRSHGLIDVADLAIAATAQLLGLPLATANIRHFPMFEGLAPPY